MKLPEPGDTFEGYEIEGLIGSGGFARVYSARTTDIGREVAVKILAPDANGYDPTLVRRFLGEARAVASLEDPHTLSLFSHGRAENGLLYMTFERLGGEDLNTLLTRRQRLSETEALHIIRQVLHSLREAHERGLLHRDIKPENIRVFPHLDDPHFVKVMDFGIAKSIIEADTPLTRTGHIVGTPRYMAPEQLMEVQLTAAADVYSVGLLLHDMLFGLESRGKPSISGLHIAESSGLSPHVRYLLNHALVAAPTGRFPDAGAMLRALDDASPAERPSQFDAGNQSDSASWSSMSTSARTPERSWQEAPPSSPNRRTALLVGFVTCIGAVTAAGLYLSEEPPPPVKTEPARRANPLATPPDARVELEEPPAAEQTANPPATCGQPVKPGHGMVEETFGLDSVRWPVYIPKDYVQGVRHPLIILIHDQMVSADSFIRHPALVSVADKHGVVLFAPEDDFVEPWMDIRDDLAFVRHGLDVVKRDLCIDEERVYTLGHGRGAKVAEKLACQVQIAGVATTNHTSGDDSDERCGEAVPQIYIHGMNDPFHPGEGGLSCTGKQRESVDRRDAIRRKFRSCSRTSKSAWKTGTGECLSWDCEVPFVSCRVQGGHNWPGMKDRVIDTSRCESAPPKFPYARTIWSFFENGVVGD